MPNLIEIYDLKSLVDHRYIHRKIDRKHFIAWDQQLFTTKFTAYSTFCLFRCHSGTCCTIFGKTHSSSRRGCPDINFSKRYCSPITSYANSLELKIHATGAWGIKRRHNFRQGGPRGSLNKARIDMVIDNMAEHLWKMKFVSPTAAPLFGIYATTSIEAKLRQITVCHENIPS